MRGRSRLRLGAASGAACYGAPCARASRRPRECGRSRSAPGTARPTGEEPLGAPRSPSEPLGAPRSPSEPFHGLLEPQGSGRGRRRQGHGRGDGPLRRIGPAAAGRPGGPIPPLPFGAALCRRARPGGPGPGRGPFNFGGPFPAGTDAAWPGRSGPVRSGSVRPSRAWQGRVRPARAGCLRAVCRRPAPPGEIEESVGWRNVLCAVPNCIFWSNFWI